MYTLLRKPDDIAELPFQIRVDGIANFLEQLDDSVWLEDTTRQDTFKEHVETNTLSVLSTDLNQTTFSFDMQKRHPFLYEPISILMQEVLQRLIELYDGIIHKILIVKLKANSQIPLHADSGFALQYTFRIHIPIVTNDKVTFTVDEKTINMKKGYLYEINNLKKHAVCNGSDEDRIHMIIDIMGNRTVGECAKVLEEREKELIHTHT